LDTHNLILDAYSQCRKVRVPTSSEVLTTAQLHHLLSLHEQIPKDAFSDERGFWKWLNNAYKTGILPSVKLNMIEVTATCLAEGLEIIDETKKMQPLHLKKNRRVQQLGFEFDYFD
jgi:hypothetical protein